MNLLRRFTLVGTTATVVDVAVFVVLASSVGWPVWWADANSRMTFGAIR